MSYLLSPLPQSRDFPPKSSSFSGLISDQVCLHNIVKSIILLFTATSPVKVNVITCLDYCKSLLTGLSCNPAFLHPAFLCSQSVDIPISQSFLISSHCSKTEAKIFYNKTYIIPMAPPKPRPKTVSGSYLLN